MRLCQYFGWLRCCQAGDTLGRIDFLIGLREQRRMPKRPSSGDCAGGGALRGYQRIANRRGLKSGSDKMTGPWGVI